MIAIFVFESIYNWKESKTLYEGLSWGKRFRFYYGHKMIPHHKLNNNDEKNPINKGFFYLFFSNNCIQIYKDWDDFILGLTGN
jgi:hypothetical protein